MKAMLLDRIAAIDTSPLRMVDLPMPEPAPGEIRIKVHCCAICRTDLHVIEGDLAQCKMPIVPGHQIVGTVDKLGQGTGKGDRRLLPERLDQPSVGARCFAQKAPVPFSVGQRVGVAWLRHTCGECGFCKAEKENLCESARFTGYHADGGYAEYAIAPAAFCYEIPQSFSDVEAAPLLCAGIIGYRALKRCRLPKGGKFGIYGFGSSAHVVLQIALHRGCEVYVVTRGEKHRQLAREMGAAWVGEDAEKMPVKVDSAIIFAPAGELVPPALCSLAKGGALALAGIYMTPIPEMDYEQHLFYERDVHSVTCNTRTDGRELLAEAAAIPVRAHTTLYPLAEANRALLDLKNDRINGTGVLAIE
ncbi:MAG: zinc-dependent alcohol dehydrogenase family protein [Thermoguttaceae bacterium]